MPIWNINSTELPYSLWWLLCSHSSSPSYYIRYALQQSWRRVNVRFGSSVGPMAWAGEQRFSFSVLSYFSSAIRNRKKSTTRSAKLFTKRRPFVIRNFRPCLICWFKSQRQFDTRKMESDSTTSTLDLFCERLFLSSKFLARSSTLAIAKHVLHLLWSLWCLHCSMTKRSQKEKKNM